ncbi:cell division control protein Cdc25 [Rhodotorula toruloides]|uniref:Cell division control protein Cdc25 n=1 Tax=Rhodotorula toruloides TaxID=5286 RepID=A0A511KBN5_RHOTO|nr:cell division control protein Cdc25 [Rhodotorula toruloides]
MGDAAHPVTAAEPLYVRALYSYNGADSSSLSFRQGDIIEVLSTLESGWWDGVVLQWGVRGWFPSNFVEELSQDEALWVVNGGDDNRRGSIASEMSRRDSEQGDFSSGALSALAGMDLNGGIARDPTLQDFMSGGEFDLSSFSTGGDIFGEIAAATSAVPSSATPSVPMSRHQSSAGRTGPLHTSTLSIGSSTGDADYWVPKMGQSGQLFYYNTQTGETSRDMPIDGKGDGTRIDPSEFGVEESAPSHGGFVDLRRPNSDSDWSERMTEDGRAVYFVNLRTGEQSWDPPTSSSRRTSIRPRAPAADAASLLSSWTERPAHPTPADLAAAEHPETSKRVSGASDDSALDTTFANLTRCERRASDDADDGYAADPGRGHRTASAATTELLGPPPPPLVADLEEMASRVLRALVAFVALGGVASGACGRNPAEQRDQLVQAGDDVVHAIRVVLHATGALEHSVLTSPFASSVSPVNKIATGLPPRPPLPPSAQAELRPYSRRLISNLSKLSFSLRAMWGLLETTDEDQFVPEDDSPADPEEFLRRVQARQQALTDRRIARDARFGHETKLRREILQGAQDVGGQVSNFLRAFQSILLSLIAAGVFSPASLAELRAPKSRQGSLRTEATALFLPGAGFGGNWRGNGFVSLPTARETYSSSENKALAYEWPSKPFTREVVENFARDARRLVDLAHAVASSDGSARAYDQAGAMQQTLAELLARIEDIDIAAGVDSQMPRADDSRPNSTDSVGTSLAGYSASVIEAKSLLADFETRKQALYDVAPRLLSALQSRMPIRSHARLVMASQPLVNAPLLGVSVPTLAAPVFSSSQLSDLDDDLPQLVSGLCDTLHALVATAERQSKAPKHVRQASRSYRDSTFGTSTAESLTSGSAARFSQGQQSTVPSTVPSVRDSVDSDFFFSGQAIPSHPGDSPRASLAPSSSDKDTIRSQTSTNGMGPVRGSIPPASRSSVSNNSSVEMLDTPSGLPPGWDGRRRGSVATTMTSSSGGGMAGQSLPSLFEGPSDSHFSPSRGSTKNIQKLLGELPPELMQPEPARPWYLERDWNDEDLSFTMENTIKGGTLRGLVIAATSHEGRVDSSYLSAFLMTYRTFCSPHALLDHLVERYLMPRPQGLSPEEYHDWETKKQRPVRARVTNLLKTWVREYMDNEDLDRDVLERIRDFALNTMAEKGQSLQICKSVDEKLQGASRRPVGNLAPGPLPQPIVPRNLKKIKLVDIEPLELARQLTIMDGRLFQRIPPQECLSKAWPKQFGSDAPNISAMIDMSNAVTRWVTESILAQEDLKKRAAIVKHFVAIAERCLALNNFSTLIHIIAGLNSTPIHRLRRTWEVVSQKTMITLGMLNRLMKPDKNYKEYRDILRKSAPPCVPFLGVYLTDWTFIGDGNPDMIREKPHQINFQKRQKASELILMIKLHQATTYNLQAVPAIAKFLQDALFPQFLDPANEDQRLYEISLALEPRERDDEKIARLLSESGFI